MANLPADWVGMLCMAVPMSPSAPEDWRRGIHIRRALSSSYSVDNSGHKAASLGTLYYLASAPAISGRWDMHADPNRAQNRRSILEHV